MNRIEKFDHAFAALPALIQKSRPRCSLILGSGWSEALPPTLRIVAEVPYGEIPGLGETRVPGHAGRLVLALKNDAPILFFCGRRHWYECGEWDPVILPVEFSRRLEVSSLFVTNASGGVNPNLEPGDLMIVHDHVNLFGMNPLQGPYRPEWGPRFPDLSRLYSRKLSGIVRASMQSAGLNVQEGIYAYVPGPCYETPAEVAMLRAVGVDAVGMSTVPECILASAIGMNVAAISFIANKAAGLHAAQLSHEKILRRTQCSAERFQAVLDGVIEGVST